MDGIALIVGITGALLAIAALSQITGLTDRVRKLETQLRLKSDDVWTAAVGQPMPAATTASVAGAAVTPATVTAPQEPLLTPSFASTAGAVVEGLGLPVGHAMEGAFD